MEIRLVDGSFQFAELGPRGFQHEGHGYILTGLGREEGRVQGDVVDATAGQIELCELIVVQRFDRRAGETA